MVPTATLIVFLALQVGVLTNNPLFPQQLQVTLGKTAVPTMQLLSRNR